MRTKNSDGNVVINDSVELITDQAVEPIVSQEFDREVAEEAFMNEPVTIIVAESADENVNPMPMPSVNGVVQPCPRGVELTIKRKYVEVLARCKETRYSQHTSNPMEPDRIEMRERTALSYPFSVVLDKNPKGPAWLKAVVAERA